MKALITFLSAIILLTGCDTLKKTSNSTGTVFSLNGEWELVSNIPENTLIGSRVTVAPFIPEARFSKLLNNTQCYRDTDIKWKNIATDNNGGFTINNLLSVCNAGTPSYLPAAITVTNTNEIRLSGRNSAGQDNVQVWKRIR